MADAAANPPAAEEEVSLRPGGMTGAPPGLSLRPGGGMSMGNFGLMSAPTRSKKEISVPRSKEHGGEPLKYSKEVLLKFKEKFVSLPAELQGSNIEIVLTDSGPAEPAQWGHAEPRGPPAGGRGGGAVGAGPGGGGAPAGGGNDTRNWRTRTELPPQREEQGGRDRQDRGGRRGGGGGGGHRGPPPTVFPNNGPGPDIKKADSPWQIGQVKDDNEKLLRSVKGILNKITPEKFEKLSDQIVNSGITTADILRGVISLIFDKAVAEPTFCALYAKLCVKLSKGLPEFPPAEGEDKPMTFRRILLNTCQEEFEGAANARAAAMAEIAAIPNCSPEQREIMLRKVKLATLGNIRLIGELFKEKMIMEKILHACISDLLGKSKDLPPEENVEALCNLLMTVGKHLDASQRQTAKPLVESYFVRLNNFTKSDKLVSRIKFMCKDVIDLRKNKWIPRREKLEAKTIEQVHAEAAAEMGLVRPQGGGRQHAPPQHHGGHGGHHGGHGGHGGPPGAFDDDRMMFPEGPSGPQSDGWEVAGRKKKAGEAQAAGGQYSALTGPYVPNARPDAHKPSAAPAPVAEAAPTFVEQVQPVPAAAAPEEKKAGPLSDEDLTKKLDNLLEELVNVRDAKEVILSLEEFVSNGQVADKDVLGKTFAEKCITFILDKSNEKDGDLVTQVLLQMVAKEMVGWEPMVEQVKGIYATMEDLSLDVPMAPKLMGNLVATFIIESKGKVTMAFIQECCEAMEDIFTRRDSAFPIFKTLKAKGPFMKLLMDQKPDVKAYLTDEEADTLKEDLDKEGLSALWS